MGVVSLMTKNITIVQMNDSHAYLDLHPELFWEHGQAVYRLAGGYARIATLLKHRCNITAIKSFPST